MINEITVESFAICLSFSVDYFQHVISTLSSSERFREEDRNNRQQEIGRTGKIGKKKGLKTS
jgi:hypothetical protein